MDVRGNNIYLLKAITQKTLKTIHQSLSTTYKLLTSVLKDRAYSQLEQHDLFPLAQGCRRGSYGFKDQLMTNKMILENCKKRKRNLSCAWIDYKKAFDSVPHEWILRSLELFKVSPRVVGF